MGCGTSKSRLAKVRRTENEFPIREATAADFEDKKVLQSQLSTVLEQLTVLTNQNQELSKDLKKLKTTNENLMTKNQDITSSYDNQIKKLESKVLDLSKVNVKNEKEESDVINTSPQNSLNNATSPLVREIASKYRSDIGSRIQSLRSPTKLSPLKSNNPSPIEENIEKPSERKSNSFVPTNPVPQLVPPKFKSANTRSASSVRLLTTLSTTFETCPLSTALVLEVGAVTTRAGFAHDLIPRVVEPTLIGRPRNTLEKTLLAKEDVFVGTHANEHRGILDCSTPIADYGKIINWDEWEAVIEHSLDELEREIDQQPMSLVVPSNISGEQVHQTLELLFEAGVPSMCLHKDLFCSLVSAGKMSGFVLDCGYGHSTAGYVMNGCVVSDSVFTSSMGGKFLASCLSSHLRGMGSPIHKGPVREELMAQWSWDTEKERIAVMPDGSTFELPRPQKYTYQFFEGATSENIDGISELLTQSTQFTCRHMETTCAQNPIVICGGVSNITGFQQRLTENLTSKFYSPFTPKSSSKKLLSPKRPLSFRDSDSMTDKSGDSKKSSCGFDSIIYQKHRQHSSWIGGAILSELTVGPLWCSKQQYDECGATICYRLWS